jgi:imidazoleglycerol-phosphate dehydratase
MSRIAKLSRATSESKIELELNLDGSGQSEIETGVPFFDHMLTAFF